MKTVTAKEIQTEVLNAQEALLKKTNAIVRGKEEIASHIAGLDELGFTGSAHKLDTRTKEAKELHDLADMYSFEYPGLKFIPAQVMLNMCNKYGLAIDHVSRYTGEVPAWALAQIAANKRHLGTERVYDVDLHWEQARQLFDERSKDFNGRLRIWCVGGSYIGHSGYEPKEQPKTLNYDVQVFPVKVTELRVPDAGMKNRSNLYIAAPIADMDIRSYEHVVNGQIVAIPSLDPIVCLNVKGGYIVLAAWGEEGMDPQVFNAASN